MDFLTQLFEIGRRSWLVLFLVALFLGALVMTVWIMVEGVLRARRQRAAEVAREAAWQDEVACGEWSRGQVRRWAAQEARDGFEAVREAAPDSTGRETGEARGVMALPWRELRQAVRTEFSGDN